MASLELCIVCRSTPTLRVRVDNRTPRSLWSPSVSLTGKAVHESKIRVLTRVPVVRALYLTPGQSPGECRRAVGLWTCLEFLVVWPNGLKHLVLGAKWEVPV